MILILDDVLRFRGPVVLILSHHRERQCEVRAWLRGSIHILITGLAVIMGFIGQAKLDLAIRIASRLRII